MQESQEEPEEENPSKLASIRKAFETRSISVDEKIVERRREEVRQEQTIQEEEKENVGVCRFENRYFPFMSQLFLVIKFMYMLRADQMFSRFVFHFPPPPLFFNSQLIFSLSLDRSQLRYVRAVVSVQQNADGPLNRE